MRDIKRCYDVAARTRCRRRNDELNRVRTPRMLFVRLVYDFSIYALLHAKRRSRRFTPCTKSVSTTCTLIDESILSRVERTPRHIATPSVISKEVPEMGSGGVN